MDTSFSHFENSSPPPPQPEMVGWPVSEVQTVPKDFALKEQVFCSHLPCAQTCLTRSMKFEEILGGRELWCICRQTRNFIPNEKKALSQVQNFLKLVDGRYELGSTLEERKTCASLQLGNWSKQLYSNRTHL